MAGALRRTDDLVLFGGVGFFPSQIEEILSEFEGTSSCYQIVLDQEAGVDTLEIRVEISGKIPSLDEVKTLETLRQQVARRIQTVLDVEARITLVEPQSLPHSDERAQRSHAIVRDDTKIGQRAGQVAQPQPGIGLGAGMRSHFTHLGKDGAGLAPTCVILTGISLNTHRGENDGC